MKPITLDEVEYITHRLVVEMMDYGEPMGNFATRYPHKLESCLEQPFATFDGVDFYPALVDKAAAIFYLTIKNHPFENGNKRMAVVLMLLFLFKNGKFLSVDPGELYKLALIVADSDIPIDDYLPMLTDTLRDFVINRNR